MSKYKVGDRVKVRDDIKRLDSYRGVSVTGGMEKMAGESFTIASAQYEGGWYYRLVETSCIWTDEMFDGRSLPDDANSSIYTAVTEDPKVTLHKQIAAELSRIYEAKNHDYGDSFQDAYREFGLISAVIRITDKVNRLKSLCTKEQRVADESIKDTLLDCANYCIMTLMALEDKQ